MNLFVRYLPLALVVVVFRGFGQTPATAPQPPAQTQPAAPSTAKVEMPSDPATLLELAAKKNGLQNVGSHPLHIKATYQLIDDKGSVKETGTIDEIRVSDKKYRLTYSSPSFNQTDYSTDAGLFRVGNRSWPSDPLFAAYDSLFPLLPTKDGMSKYKIGVERKALGMANVDCFTLAGANPSPFSHSSVYCLNPNTPILRLVETLHGASQSMYNSVASVGGAYIAEDSTYLEMGQPLARVHLNSVNSVSKMDESIFLPPESAARIPRRMTRLPPGVRPKLIYGFPAELPTITVFDHPDVVMQAVIGTDGKVVSARILSGPPILKQAALGAVQRWIFEPILLDGEPVEVSIEFDFTVTTPQRAQF